MTDPPREKSATALSPDQRAKIKALVLDTNSLGHRHLDLGVLEDWGQRCLDNDLELWLPDIVLAEWAEHAAEMFDAARSASSEERRWLDRLDIAPQWPFEDREAVIEHVIEAATATAGVRVLQLDPDDAKEALFDQVLKRAPGTREKGVKTGAADSAWVRTVARAAHGDLEAVLVVSANRKDIESLCERLGWNVPTIATRLFDVPQVLTLYQAASTAQAWQVCRAVAAALPTQWLREPHEFDIGGVDSAALGYELSRHVDEDVAEFVQGGVLTSVDELVGVERVLVDGDGSTYFAELYLLATASVQTAAPDNSGETQYEEFDVPNVLLRLRAEVKTSDGTLDRLISDGDRAEIFAREETVRRPAIGLQWVKAALEAVPGLKVGDFPTPDGGRLVTTVNGHVVELWVNVEENRWELTAEVDGAVIATLVCQRSPRRWGRGAHGYELKLEPEIVDANPPWQFSALLVDAIRVPAAERARLAN